MKKDLGIIAGLFLVILGLLVFGQGFNTASFVSGTPQPRVQTINEKLVSVSVKTLQVEAEVVSSASDRKKGLSKRDSLPINHGMLFVFDKKGIFGIWMKDMKFAIDVLWVDENKRIVDIASQIAPEPGKKESALTIYRPRGEASYVLEVNAGLALLNGLQIGDHVNFELTTQQ